VLQTKPVLTSLDPAWRRCMGGYNAADVHLLREPPPPHHTTGKCFGCTLATKGSAATPLHPLMAVAQLGAAAVCGLDHLALSPTLLQGPLRALATIMLPLSAVFGDACLTSMRRPVARLTRRPVTSLQLLTGGADMPYVM